MQLQLFQDTCTEVDTRDRVEPVPKDGQQMTDQVWVICNDVLKILTIRIRQATDDYASGGFGRVEGYVPKLSIRVQGHPSFDKTLTLNEFPIDVGPIYNALVSAFKGRH